MNLTELFLKLLSMSFTASYCVLFICIARLFLRRTPKIFSYLLWIIVAVRLVCPVTFESNFSLMGERFLAFANRIETGNSAENAVSDPSPNLFSPAQAQLLPEQSPNISGSGSAGKENALLSPKEQTSGIYGTSLPGTRNPAIYSQNNSGIAYDNVASGSEPDNTGAYSNSKNNDNTDAGFTDNAAGTGHASATDNVPDIETNTLSSDFPYTSLTPETIAAAAAYIWLAGMFGLFGHYAHSCLHLNRRLTKKSIYSCHYKGIPVYEVTGLDTPFVAGFTKPAIFLPAGLENRETYPCLAHEYTHIRRKDYLIKQSAFLLTCVYWFQPMIWLAFHLMCRDMEMSCDEMTLHNADLADRKAYSNALVRLSSETRHVSGYPLAFSENNTASRIRNILNLKKPASRVLTICAILLGVFAAGLLTNPEGSSVRADEPVTHPTGTQVIMDTPSTTDSFSTAASGNTFGNNSAPVSTGDQNRDELPYDPPLPLAGISQTPAPTDDAIGGASDSLMENPYPALIQNVCQELQDTCKKEETERAAELRREAKSLMMSYWTYLVKEQQNLQNKVNAILPGSNSTDSAEILPAMLEQLQLLNAGVNQAKTEMNYMDKTMDAIEGAANVVQAADYEIAYPLNGVLTEDNTVVRSLPKESAPEIDVLSTDDTVLVISFGKYMLQEDENFKDFFLSDAGIKQEYQNFAVILYSSEENGRKTTRKGYVHIDSLDISGSTAETYMYWIGKTWSEAFCSQDGSTLCQMAADQKAFTEWEYVNAVPDTIPAQVEWNTSRACAQNLYHVNLLTGESPVSQTASDSYDIALQYFVQTPESTVWTQRQDLEITSTPRQLQEIRYISDFLNQMVRFSEVRNYEQITDFPAYQDAYLSNYSFGPVYFNFKDSGYARINNPDPVTFLENVTTSVYMTEQAEALAERYLNLSGGIPKTDIMTMRLRKDDRITGLVQLAYVEYTFAGTDTSGKNHVSIPMYYDSTNGYWYIWIPGENDEIDAAMLKMQENLMQFTP